MAPSCGAFALALEHGARIGEERVVSRRVARPRTVDYAVVAAAEASERRRGGRATSPELARVIAARLRVMPPHEPLRREDRHGGTVERVRRLGELAGSRELLRLAPRVRRDSASAPTPGERHRAHA